MADEYNKYDKVVKCLWGESFMLIPLLQPQYIFFGIGKVIRIVKDRDFDIVQVMPKPCFQGEVSHLRNVVITGNHARRQLLTLKCGQVAMFYGRAFLKWQDMQKDDGTIKKIRRWHFIALALQGWYVPTSFDIKKAEKEDEIEDYDSMSDLQRDFLDNILGELEKIREEELGDKNDEE